MSDIHVLAIRFADLWAVDPHQMVREIYAPDIQMESMARLTRDPIEGSAQLHALESDFWRRSPTIDTSSCGSRCIKTSRASKR